MWRRAAEFLKTTQGRAVAGVLLVGLVPILILAYWLASPLWTNRTVEEQFPRTVGALIPAEMSRAQAEQEMAEASIEFIELDEAMPAAVSEPVAIYAGSFRDQDSFHRGSGSATVYRQPDGSQFVRLGNLRVTNGPDLNVYLSAATDPRSSAEVKSGGYLDLGGLKGNIGNQNYEVPAGTDITQYRSVVVYCVTFSVVFSVAPLASP